MFLQQIKNKACTVKKLHVDIIQDNKIHCPVNIQQCVYILSSCKVHLFEGIVGEEEEENVSQKYMEVNFNSQNTLRQYLKLTNGVYLNEILRIMYERKEFKYFAL